MLLQDIAEEFRVNNRIDSIIPYGEGHINDTYLVSCGSEKYILQKLNINVFPNYKGLMKNIELVTEFSKKIIEESNGDVNRETLMLIPRKNGEFYLFADGGCYRMMNFITDSIVYQQVESAAILEETGVGFGKFIARLDNFDASTLTEVIPNFHNTASRYANFELAKKENKADRLETVVDEIRFVENRKDFTRIIVDAISNKVIPLRVTHNDTKLNNILFDAKTKKAICVIDLDTIMPGSLLYDFGDAVRFACSTALEDEQDLTKVHFSIELYESFVKGFLTGIGSKITKEEVDLLHVGAKMMTIECGMRFLTDYLNGDTYFKVKYPVHNLVRARTQLKLVEEMEENEQKMVDIANKYYNK